MNLWQKWKKKLHLFIWLPSGKCSSLTLVSHNLPFVFPRFSTTKASMAKKLKTKLWMAFVLRTNSFIFVKYNNTKHCFQFSFIVSRISNHIHIQYMFFFSFFLSLHKPIHISGVFYVLRFFVVVQMLYMLNSLLCPPPIQHLIWVIAINGATKKNFSYFIFPPLS